MLQRDLPRAIAEFERRRSRLRRCPGARLPAAGSRRPCPGARRRRAARRRRGARSSRSRDADRRRQRDRDRRGVDDGRRDPTRSARPRRSARGRRRRRRLVSQAGPGRVGGDLDEPRPAGRGARRRASDRRRRPARRGRRPTRCAMDSPPRRLGHGSSLRSFVPNRRRGDRRSRLRRHPSASSPRTGSQTASSSPTSTPLAAHRRGDRSAARRAISRGSPRRWRAKPPSARSRHGPMRRSTATPSTEIGARIAVSDGRPRELLARIEATRVMAARTPELRPPADPEIARLLAELRGHEVTLADASVSDAERQEAERNHARLEREVRRRARTARGDASTRINVRREIESALGLLGDRQLLAHARLDGRLLRRFGGRRPGSTARPRVDRRRQRADRGGDVLVCTDSTAPKVRRSLARRRRGDALRLCRRARRDRPPAGSSPSRSTRSSSCRPPCSTTCRGACCRRSPVARCR